MRTISLLILCSLVVGCNETETSQIQLEQTHSCSEFATYQELTTNGNMELGTQGWSAMASATLQASSDALQGSKAMLVTDRTNTYAGAEQDVTANISTCVMVHASAYVKLAEGAGEQTLVLYAYQNDGAGANYHLLDAITITPDDGWTRLYGVIKPKISGNLSSWKLQIHSSATGFDFYLDKVSLLPPRWGADPQPQESNFIRAQGRHLVVGAAANRVRLRGINLIRYSDSSGDQAVNLFNSKNFDEGVYQELADLGMNVARLNLDYRLFEDDAEPYAYKAEGWGFLNDQIKYAKAAGMYLILDLHTPQGGYQSVGNQGNSNFWPSGTANRKRLQALWEEIAQRYVDEPQIAGFDLINEPAPTHAAEWYEFAQTLITAIRKVNQRHVLIIEQPFPKTWDDTGFPDFTGENLMYDMHFYDPFTFTFQGWETDTAYTYPDSNSKWGKDRQYKWLERYLLRYGKKYNRPVNIGEWGMTTNAFSNGGDTLMAHNGALFAKYGINAQFFAYHDPYFGVYQNKVGYPAEDSYTALKLAALEALD